MRRRRQRFTVTLDDGSRHVVLTYTAEGAKAYYNYSRTRTVIGVERGDYRIKARRAEQTTRGGFKLDHEAIDIAKLMLGLSLPVRIRFNSRAGSTNGNYRFRGAGGARTTGQPHHDIMLKSYLTPEQATRTLWHELTHAMQAERAIAAGRKWADVTLEQKRWSYSRRPIEVEARAMAEKMAHEALATC